MTNPEKVLMLCYKAALLCRLNEDSERVIDYSNKASRLKCRGRLSDQYELRLLQVHAHENPGNHRLAEYLSLSLKCFAKANLFTQ